MRVHPLTEKRLPDLERLLASDGIADNCWCMWFMKRVADFHADGRERNRDEFIAMSRRSPEPLGVIAYAGNEPVGWCAAGPRARYTRAITTPTMKGSDRSEDESVWLVPCLFTRSAERIPGVARALLDGAVELARRQGANAIEGFPDAGGKRSDRGARGDERLFEAYGFEAVRRPSPVRVIMRKKL